MGLIKEVMDFCMEETKFWNAKPKPNRKKYPCLRDYQEGKARAFIEVVEYIKELAEGEKEGD